MTISQPTSRQGSRPLAASFYGLIQAFARWRRRRRAAAELVRLAQVGDYLLRDVGLDPRLVRLDPAASADRIIRRD